MTEGPRGTHGSPELDDDAAKLRALGADPGPTWADLRIPTLDDDGHVLVVTPAEFARMNRVIYDAAKSGGDGDAAAAEALRAAGMDDAYIVSRRGKVTRIKVRDGSE